MILPHATAFNEAAAPEMLAPVAQALGARKAGQGLYDLAVALGAPIRLADIGMKEDGLDRAADIAVQSPYWNPRAFTKDDIRKLMGEAFAGIRPA